MNVLLLKLALTPALIGVVSVAGRRWGPWVSGWLVGLPLTSGPVALFLALGQGSAFGTRAAAGILAGTLSAGVFCLVYSWLAFPCAWWLTLPASWLVFLAFDRRGIRTVRLNVDAASLTNAQQLYRRLGFQVVDTYSNFEKIASLG